MDIATGFLVYAALFRIAVIAAGSLAVYLGYRLFVTAGRRGGTDASAKGADFELSLKNAAPGTVFAFFGALVIIFMLVQGNPELVIEDMGLLQDRVGAAAAETAGAKPSQRIILKGGGAPISTTFADLMAAGNDKQRQGDDEGALAAYLDALARPDVTLAEAAAAFNELAWLYQKHGDVDAALPVVRLAVRLAPMTAGFQHTLATVLAKRGQRDEALAAMRVAAALDARYEQDLQTLEGSTREP